MGIIKAFKLGFDYLKYDEDGNVQDTRSEERLCFSRLCTCSGKR